MYFDDGYKTKCRSIVNKCKMCLDRIIKWIFGVFSAKLICIMFRKYDIASGYKIRLVIRTGTYIRQTKTPKVVTVRAYGTCRIPVMVAQQGIRIIPMR